MYTVPSGPITGAAPEARGPIVAARNVFAAGAVTTLAKPVLAASACGYLHSEWLVPAAAASAAMHSTCLMFIAISLDEVSSRRRAVVRVELTMQTAQLSPLRLCSNAASICVGSKSGGVAGVVPKQVATGS